LLRERERRRSPWLHAAALVASSNGLPFPANGTITQAWQLRGGCLSLCVCQVFAELDLYRRGGAFVGAAALYLPRLASVHCNNDGLMGRHSRSNRWPGFDRFQHNRRNRKRGDQACVGRDLCRGGEVLLVGASSAARSAADMTYNVTYNPATASAPGLPR